MASCCAARPPEYRRVPVDRIPDLIPLLVEVSGPGDPLRSYRCRQCGQMWQQYVVDGEALVVQVGWANRKPEPSAAARAAPMPAPAPPPPRTSRGGLAAFVVLALVFFAISTLPPFVTGPLARGAWMARWIVGAVLVFLALQTVFGLASRKRRSARARRSA
jgi:hypothetical protein